MGASGQWWGGWGDLKSMICKPPGTLGLWTVNEPRHGPSVRSKDTLKLVPKP